MTGFNMDGYVDVAERIAEFSDKYPEGSLQSKLTYHTDPAGWFCEAYAYRTANDERPGIGHAFEPVPGKTPYTKDSEAMNAETSAWGRAIVALGFQTKKIASRQEVEARNGEPHPEAQARAGDSVQPGQVIVSFGKHKGKQVHEVPRDYWEWCLANDKLRDDLRAAVELHLGLTQSGVGAGDPVPDDIPF